MGYSIGRYFREFKSRISQRIQTLSRLSPQKFRSSLTRLAKYKRNLGSLFFLLLSLVLGTEAYHHSQTEGALNWLRAHPPSEQVLEYSLGRFGFQSVKDVEKIQKVMRFAPATLDDVGSFWISPSKQWVAYYFSREQESQVTFYCKECGAPPHDWQPLGIGWEALEKLFIEISKDAIHTKGSPPKAAEAAEPARKKEVHRDPREIIY